MIPALHTAISRDQHPAAPASGPLLETTKRSPASTSDRTGRDSPIGARRLDEASRAWVDALRQGDPRRDEAVGALHALLVRQARFEIRRRTALLTHPSGADLDDLAVQAADDAVISILAKLDQFRGDSLFTTWARRFVQREAPAKIRRRLGRAREVPSANDFERGRLWAVDADSPHEYCVATELAGTLTRLINDDLSPRQREVLIALAIDDVPAESLAKRLHTTTGALYKSIHDARRKLKCSLERPA